MSNHKVSLYRDSRRESNKTRNKMNNRREMLMNLMKNNKIPKVLQR